jgi:hypothetical protein
MAEKSFVNEVAEMLGVAEEELGDALALPLALEVELLDELPHPTATADMTAMSANARNRPKTKLHSPVFWRRVRRRSSPAGRAQAPVLDTLADLSAAVHAS